MSILRAASPPALLLSLVIACAAGNGSGSNCAAGTVDLKHDGSCSYKCTPGPNAPDDPIDPQFTDDNCDGSDGVVARCLYVATDGVDTPEAGSRTTPFKTIAFAIAQAKTRQMDVCVSGEPYTGEVDLVSGVNVYGGFNEHDPDFAFRRSATTQSTLTAKGTVVVAAGIDIETHFEGFVLNSGVEDPPAKGKGSYGVRLLGGLGTLFVRYNLITTAGGQDGADGSPGGDGAAGASGANGEAGCDGCGSAEAPNPPGGGLGAAAPASPCGGASGGKGGQGGYDQSGGLPGGNGTGANSQGGQAGPGNSSCPTSGGGNGTDGQSPTETGKAGVDGAAGSATGTFDMNALFTPANAGDGSVGEPGNAEAAADPEGPAVARVRREPEHKAAARASGSLRVRGSSLRAETRFKLEKVETEARGARAGTAAPAEKVVLATVDSTTVGRAEKAATDRKAGAAATAAAEPAGRARASRPRRASCSTRRRRTSAPRSAADKAAPAETARRTTDRMDLGSRT
jgi:hypothetical protein